MVTGKLKIKKRKNPKMENVIEIKNLVKSFGEVKAVNDLSFKVKEGELFAFLGVNGAGKSTTISIMCGASETDVTAIMNGIKEGIDCKLSFFGTEVSVPAMAVIVLCSTAVLIGVYVLINALKKKRA